MHIEVFTGSCRLCEGAVALVERVAQGQEIEVLSIDGDRAKEYGLRAVPSIVIDGEIEFQRQPTEDEFTQALARHA